MQCPEPISTLSVISMSVMSRLARDAALSNVVLSHSFVEVILIDTSYSIDYQLMR